jgi:hypothetical protein
MMPPTPLASRVFDGKRYQLLDAYTWEERGSAVKASTKDKNTIKQLVRRFEKFGYHVRRESWVRPMRSGNITTTYFYGRKK